MAVRVRECHYAQKWHGFNMKPGYLFGHTDRSGVEGFVWTGGVRDKRRRDGSVCGKEVRVFKAILPAHWEQNIRAEWYPEWISATSGLGQAILEKSVHRKNKIIPDYRPKGRSPQGFYFTSDKSRYPTYTADAWRYQNK